MAVGPSSVHTVAKRIGYIGMGIMGAPMAKNLVEAGHTLSVWNRTRRKCDALADVGATVADSPAALAADHPDVIFLNVTDTPDVEAVLFGNDQIAGIADSAHQGLIVVDNSTISPVATQRFAERLAEHDTQLVDAPVSGGDTGARNGTLSIMVGGEDEAVAKVRPLLEVLGKSVVHLGPVGSGQACKACNQIAVAGNLLAACEALALAKQTGLDLEKMIEVVAGGAGGSWQLANLGPKIARGDHEPGFMIDLILKDLKIVLDTARQHGLPLNITALADGYFRSASANGAGDRGTQAVAQTLERLGGFGYTD